MSGINLDELSDVGIVDSGGDELDINANGSINVEATDLDIRDLVNTQDSVAIGDATNLFDVSIMDSAFDVLSNGFPIMGIRQDAGGSPVSADGDAHPLVFDNDGNLKTSTALSSNVADDDADSGNPIKMGGRGVSGALTALSASNDRYDLLGDLYRRTWINSSANIAIETTAETVGTSAAEVVSVPLAGRRFVTIQNEGSADVYFGHSAGVTVANGMKITKKSSATYEFGEDIDIFMISGSAGQDVRILEAG